MTVEEIQVRPDGDAGAVLTLKGVTVPLTYPEMAALAFALLRTTQQQAQGMGASQWRLYHPLNL